jgi:hypothetical protein
MEIKVDIKNPIVLMLLGCAIIGGGVWFGWKHPEKLKDLIRSNYDRDAIVDVEKMRASIDDNLLLFLRSELIQKAVADEAVESKAATIENDVEILDVSARPRGYFKNRQDFYLAREDRRVDIRFLYRYGTQTGKATADARLSRGGNWTLYTVELVD